MFETSPLNFPHLKYFTKKEKTLKFETENTSFWYFGLQFKKSLLIFKISTLNFVQLKNFAKTQKCLNFREKILYFGHFH